MTNTIRKGVSLLLVFTMSFMPFHAYADEMSDTGRSAAALGRNIVNQYNRAPATYQDGTISIPELNNGRYTQSTENQVNTQGFYFGENSSSSEEMNALYPDSGSPTVSDAQAAGGSLNDINALGRDAKAAMWNDANSENPQTIMGGAYKTLVDAYNMPKPDMTNDPDLQMSREIYENIDEISQSFADCNTETSYTPRTSTEYISNIKTCERILDKSTACQVTHDIDARARDVNFDRETLESFGSTTYTHSWSSQVGSSKTLTISTNGRYQSRGVYRFYVSDPSLYQSFDVLGQVYLRWGGAITLTDPSGRGTLVASNTSVEWVEDGQYYRPSYHRGAGWYDPAVRRLGPLLRQGWNTLTIYIHDRASNSAIGAEISLTLSSPVIIDADTWTPAECISALEGVSDGFATGTVRCIDSYQTTNNCALVNGVEVCDGDLARPPLYLRREGIGKFCRTVDVRVDYSWYKGSYCYTAADGTEVCTQTGTTSATTCDVLESTESCRFLDSKCVEGSQLQWWQDLNRTCYLSEETWDCPTPVEVTDYTTNTQFNCAGPVRCMGSDCIDPTRTQSTGFADALARMNAAQFMTQDMNCAENGDCRVFAGEHYECKIAVGGVQDCCDVPTMTSAGTYIQAAMAISKLDSSLMSLEGGTGGAIKGAYQTVRQPIANAVSEVTKPFTSYAENITGQVEELFNPAEEWLNSMKEEISKQIEEMFKDLFTDTAENMVGEAGAGGTASAGSNQAATEATAGIMDAAASAFSVISAVYTAYVVAVMVIQAVYKCEEEEFMLASKKDTNSCHYVGSYCDQYTDSVTETCIVKKESYCCFNSPLSRIVNEQALPQLIPWWQFWVNPWGTAENPRCQGFTFDQVARIDWNRVDLGEWVAMLNMYDLMPTPESINFDSITGTGSALNGVNSGQTITTTNPDGSVAQSTHDGRMDVQERSVERMNGVNVDELRTESGRIIQLDYTGQ